MRTNSAAALVLLCASPLCGHRLDQYLQATMLSLDKDSVHVSMRLIPGVAVFSSVLSAIDKNGDAMISESEKRAYAEQVLGDISLTVDGRALNLRLISVSFPKIEEMKEGLGEIQMDFGASQSGVSLRHTLIFNNRHQSKISAYLVNCLAPDDPNIRIVTQNRNELQSFYRMQYSQADAPAIVSQPVIRSSLLFWFRGFSSMFQLGMHHIAEGTDHLLFLLTLLLPAPLIAVGSRWTGLASTRHGVAQILRIVTAFTVGHSITLALAVLGFLHVPSRAIEVLIAVSILVSAIHALRPLIPGKEAGIAALFGLIHGLAFAATMGDLGLSWGTRLISILGFNLGIETMQLLVVAAIIPSLLLLSRTRAYSVVRIGGAVFAGVASLGWLAERLLQIHSEVDVMVADVAHYAIWIAAILMLAGLAQAAARTYKIRWPVTPVS